MSKPKNIISQFVSSTLLFFLRPYKKYNLTNNEKAPNYSLDSCLVSLLVSCLI